MTTDSDQAPVGTVTPSDEPVSPVSTQTAPELAQVLEEMKAIKGQLSALQSSKDRGTARVSREINTLKDQVSQFEKMREYLEKYNDPAEAARQLALDQLLSGQGEAEEEPELKEQQPLDSQPEANALGQVKNYLDLMGLAIDPNAVVATPAYLNALREGKTPAQAAAAATSGQPPAPAVTGVPPASAQSGGYTPAGTVSTADALMIQYQQELAKTPRGNASALWALKSKYRQMGLTDLW